MALKTIDIVHLYPEEMNIYGDNGNINTLVWRLKAYGYNPKVHMIGVGDSIPEKVDILLAGGGQDSGQNIIQDDLKSRAEQLKSMVSDGVVMIVICGMYQLFGHYFAPNDNHSILGIGVFDAYTEAKDRRLIGNIVTKSPFGRLVGFENHSGQTFLSQSQLPLGKVLKGFGNNETDDKEGAVTINAFGTYLHGPLLPKNPALADELIKRSLDRRYGEAKLGSIDDSIAHKAADIAAKRP